MLLLFPRARLDSHELAAAEQSRQGEDTMHGLSPIVLPKSQALPCSNAPC